MTNHNLAATDDQHQLGEHCVTDRPTPAGQAPKGEIIKLNDIDTYVSKPAGYPRSPARLLLFLSGGTGVRSTNNQLQADMYALEGYLVVMPDLFDNDPAPNLEPVAMTEVQTTLDLVKLRVVEVGKSFMLDMWLARHTAEHAMPIVHRVLQACHDEFADAVRAGAGVYAVGYCIGGRYVLLLGGGTADTSPLIRAGAVAHPALVEASDFDGLRTPLSLACVVDDPLFPTEVRVAGAETLARNGVEHEVKLYEGVPHGFAVVGGYNEAKISEAQSNAFEQMLDWLQSH